MGNRRGGESIPVVTDIVAGSTLGTTTNAEGIYVTTNVPAGAQTRVFSSVGLVTARVPVTVIDDQPTPVATTRLAEDTTEPSEAGSWATARPIVGTSPARPATSTSCRDR